MRALSTALISFALCLIVLLSVARVHADGISDTVLRAERRDTEGDTDGDGGGVDTGKDPVDNNGGIDPDGADNKPDDGGDGNAADGGAPGTGLGDGVNDPVPYNDTSDSGTNTTTVGKMMTPPPINAEQLAGLLVAGVFFAIFLPGFFCLWNIQTPQAFTTLDGSDASKKNQ